MEEPFLVRESCKTLNIAGGLRTKGPPLAQGWLHPDALSSVEPIFDLASQRYAGIAGNLV